VTNVVSPHAAPDVVTTTARFPFAVVDLANLPPPDVIKDINYEKIVAARKVLLKDLFDKWGIPYNVEGLETDPSIIHQQADAYREMLDLVSINEASLANMVAYSRGADLDNLAALVGLRRLVIKKGDPTATPPIPDVMQPDSELRELIRVALDGTAIGLTGGSYKLIAQQASSAVKSVTVIRTSPGHLTIALLGRGPNGIVDPEEVRKVNDAIQADKGAQLTDIVSVVSAAPEFYDIVVNAIIPPGPSIHDVKAAIESELRKEADHLATIGGEVRTSALIAAGRVKPITKFSLVEPTRHLIPAAHGVMIARNITANVEMGID